MAIDLSNIIKETIEATLEINLSSATPVNEIVKSNKNSLKNKNLIAIDSNFKFESIEAKFRFIFPAYTSSFIFNTIMMEEGEPSLDVNDDIADAIKEISSQISGSLETSINANTDEELGTCKFEISNLNLDSSGSYEDVENLIKFIIKIEDKSLEIYISFNNEFLPYIEELMKNKEEVIDIIEDEDINIEENSDIVDIQEDENTQNNIDNEDNIEIENKETNTNNEDDSENIQEENEDDIKNKKLKKLIMIIGGLLIIIIITFIALFFMGTFDKKETILNDVNKTKLSKRELLLRDIKDKKINYSNDLINIKKLNKRLSLLTKYEILEVDILEKYKNMQKERLYKLKMQKLEEFANQNKEEKLFKKDLLLNNKKENRFKNGSNDLNISQNEIDKNLKLTFIQLEAIKYKKYKDIISKEITESTNISICKDKLGKTYIYIGPMYLNIVVNNIMKSIKGSQIKLINITKTQFDKRCSF